MTKNKSNAALRRLLSIVYRSFPMYLAQAAPWIHPGDQRSQQLLHHMVGDAKLYSQRITDLLMDRRAHTGYGDFPMVFTDTHDLSLDYLLTEVAFYGRQDIASIQQCLSELNADPEGRALAEEILGNARGHLESLQELLASTINDKR